MAQQTAVEWLIEQLAELDKQLDGRIKSDDSTVIKLNPTKIYEQAKKMEKSEISTAWNDGNLLGRNGHVLEEYSNGDQYYNKTYKEDKTFKKKSLWTKK